MQNRNHFLPYICHFSTNPSHNRCVVIFYRHARWLSTHFELSQLSSLAWSISGRRGAGGGGGPTEAFETYRATPSQGLTRLSLQTDKPSIERPTSQPTRFPHICADIYQRKRSRRVDRPLLVNSRWPVGHTDKHILQRRLILTCAKSLEHPTFFPKWDHIIGTERSRRFKTMNTRLVH